jgi:hypothetical protein
VRREFECLRQWCNDLWHYCGIVVTRLGGDPDQIDMIPTDYDYTLWGIEDDDYRYHEAVALELMSEAANGAYCEYLESRYWLSRDHVTV